MFRIWGSNFSKGRKTRRRAKNKSISLAEKINSIELKLADNLVAIKEKEAENVLLEIKKSRLVKKKEVAGEK